jgi:hypothetical protein
MAHAQANGGLLPVPAGWSSASCFDIAHLRARATEYRMAIPHREAHLALSVPLPLHDGQLALKFFF